MRIVDTAFNASVADPSRVPLEETAGIIEYVFRDSEGIHPLQQQIVDDPAFDALDEAFAPHVTADIADIAELGAYAQRLSDHAEQVEDTFIAGRAGVSAFELNISKTVTPKAVQELIDRGVRVFSLSFGLQSDTWPELRTVMEHNPEVLFFVATPHIAGNSISTWELNEPPSMFARDLPNVVLAGALKHHRYHAERHGEGLRIGTEANPFAVDSQPAEGARQYFMLQPSSTSRFTETPFDNTSAAAPSLAALATMAIRFLREQGIEPTREAILATLDSVMGQTVGHPKEGAPVALPYFTLDTLLLNSSQPLVPEATWGPFLAQAEPPKGFTVPDL
jgi:hypothetical protein